jgi:hypothetical protein
MRHLYTTKVTGENMQFSIVIEGVEGMFEAKNDYLGEAIITLICIFKYNILFALLESSNFLFLLTRNKKLRTMILHSGVLYAIGSARSMKKKCWQSKEDKWRDLL